MIYRRHKNAQGAPFIAGAPPGLGGGAAITTHKNLLGFDPITTFDTSIFTDGSNDLASNSDNSNYDITNAAGGYFFSMWFKLGDTLGGQVMVSKSDGSAGWAFTTNGNSMGIRLASTGNGALHEVINNVGTTWRHIIWSYDGSLDRTGVVIYLDGVLQVVTSQVENTLASNNLTVATPTQFGQRTGGQRGHGNVCDMAIYSGTIDATKAAALYNGGVRHDHRFLSFYSSTNLMYVPCGNHPDDSTNFNAIDSTSSLFTVSNGAFLDVGDSP